MFILTRKTTDRGPQGYTCERRVLINEITIYNLIKRKLTLESNI